MSVSTEKCTPGDSGKQLQVSHPGSTFALKTMKLSFIKIIIITINNNNNKINSYLFNIFARKTSFMRLINILLIFVINTKRLL